MPSSEFATSGGISCSQLALLAARSVELIHYVNTLKGSLITLTQDGCSSTGYTFLAVPLVTASVYVSAVTIMPALSSVVTTLSPTSLDHCCYHTGYPGPDYGGLDILAIDPLSGICPLISPILSSLSPSLSLTLCLSRLPAHLGRMECDLNSRNLHRWHRQ
jgi:hypothetical protein